MSDVLPRHKHEHVLVTVHGTGGLDYVELDRAGPLRILLHNDTEASYSLAPRAGPDRPPHVRIDFSGLGEVELDRAAVRAHRWHVLGWDGTVLELEPVGRLGWFARDTALSIHLGDVTVRGDAGLGWVTVELERFGPDADGSTTVGLMRLADGRAAPNAHALEWVGGNRVPVTPRRAKLRRTKLRLRVPSALAGEELYLSTATLGARGCRPIASIGRLEEIEVRGRGGWRAERTMSGGMPIYRIHTAGSIYAHSEEEIESEEAEAELEMEEDEELEAEEEAEATAELELTDVSSDQTAGDAQVVLYSASSGYAVGTVSLVEEGSVAINSFTVSPSTIDDLTAPTSVLLSWDVDNATTVMLSGVGIVDSAVTNLQVYVEQTTTFVLTAFDASLSSISSDRVTVTVNPSLSSRMVPAGTILLWQGSIATIPSGWALCDGTNSTPDLRDRFVMGAGGSASPGNSAGSDTHTHTIPALSNTFQTTTAPDHTHGFPTNWYARKLSSGSKTGIDTDGTFSTSTQTQQGGSHAHEVSVSFASFTSGNNNGDVRPPWYALAYIMKLPTTS